MTAEIVADIKPGVLRWGIFSIQRKGLSEPISDNFYQALSRGFYFLYATNKTRFRDVRPY